MPFEKSNTLRRSPRSFLSPILTLQHALNIFLSVRVQPPLLHRQLALLRQRRAAHRCPVGPNQRPVCFVPLPCLIKLLLRDDVQRLPELAVQLVVLVVLLRVGCGVYEKV